MASRSFLSLFLQTREHLEASERAHRFTVVALLLVQLALLWPFTAATRLEEQLRDETRALETSLATLEGFSERLEESHERAREAFSPALEALVEDLRLDFMELEAALVEVRTTTADAVITDATGTDADSGTDPDTNTDGSASQDEGEPFEEPADDSETVGNPWLDRLKIPTVREAENRYSLLTALEPLVDEHLLAPRFADLNRVWSDQVRSPFAEEVEVGLNQLSALRTRHGKPASTWDDLIASVTGLRRAVLALEVAPPERAYWWASPEDAPELQLGLDPSTAEELENPRVLDELRVLVNRALEHHEELEQSLRGARQRLEETSPAGNGAVGNGRFVGIDLRSLLLIWPLLLGLLLALMIWQRSRCLRQLGLLTTLMVEHGAPPNLNRWFLAEMRGSITPAGPQDPVARSCLLHGLGTLLGGWLWIGLATLQIDSSIDLMSSLRGLSTNGPALAGAGALLLAVLHRLYWNGRLIDLLSEDFSEPVPERGTEEGDDGEPFDIQDLRR